MRIRGKWLAALVAAGMWVLGTVPAAIAGPPSGAGRPEPVRFATFNASLNRLDAGDLAAELASPGSAQPDVIAEIIQRVRPEVLLINEFDYDEGGAALGAFQENYLAVAHGDAAPIHYPYAYTAPSNTGIPSGYDLDNSGTVGGPNDAFGFGFFPGQYGMAVYSMHPIEYHAVRTFQTFLWKDMPGAMLPDDPGTTEPADWYSPEELEVLRLSSKSHWDVPIDIGGRTVHFLVSHPTPPVFDGPEDRNGTRNFDEIRFWADYVDPSRSGYIYDDDGTTGGLEPGAMFVIAGDQNSDPLDGDSIPGAIQQLLDHPLVNTKVTPSSEGAVEQSALQDAINDTHLSDPAFDTADFADTTPGNLRADYVLPRKNIRILDAEVFWPLSSDPLFPLVGTFPFPSSDHRLVWVDVSVPGSASAHGETLGDVAPLLALDGALPDDAFVRTLLSSGETVAGTLFEGIPDGVGIRPGPYGNTVDVYVAHEQTTVPFFGTADFVDASVTEWTIVARGPHRGKVIASEVAIPSGDGYLRFCSASMAGPAEGFDDYVFFTGEEANDIVDITAGQPFTADPAVAPQRQAGYAVALNTETGEYDHIAGMGRLNHENTIALPGYDELVLVTTDDTFSGPSAQLYMYLADDQGALFADEGSLWAFRVTAKNGAPVSPGDPFNGANDYLDIRPGDDLEGRFIPVPDGVADGTAALAPQDGLEDWSNANNVFQFIRLEDLAYDENDPNVVYLADTGRSRVVPDAATGRLVRGPGGTVGDADNGSVFKLVFDPDDPTEVTSFTVLAQGDDPTLDAYVPFVSPDNMGASKKSLMIQEDTDDAKIWQYSLDEDAWRVVATVTDPDGESSGIVDASRWFGHGMWLLTIQGHGTYVEENLVDGVLFKRESGQLLLMNIPGS